MRRGGVSRTDGGLDRGRQLARRPVAGDGEAGRVFKRNAAQIVREGGYAGYDVLAYSEGIESEVIGALRYAEGTIRINRK